MNCMLCGHRCGADRAENETGFCSMGETAVLSKVMLHKWEEPCISGTNGSGAIFFAGCSLRCAFCQNWEISHMRKGLPVDIDRLRDIFDELADQGAHNINLVNPTLFVPFIQKAFKRYQKRIPVVYNTHGYDSLDALHRMDGIVDVYLPDLKYTYSLPARRYSSAPNYFEVAKVAIDEMFRQVGPVQYDENGLLKKGVIIRHLVLPGQIDSAKDVIDYVADHFEKGSVLFSLMSQYIPCGEATRYPEINRRLTQEEYDEVSQYLMDSPIDNGFMQELDSADEQYVPDFDLSGVLPKDEEA